MSRPTFLKHGELSAVRGPTCSRFLESLQKGIDGQLWFILNLSTAFPWKEELIGFSLLAKLDCIESTSPSLQEK